MQSGIISSYPYSSLKYTGSAITNRFSTTTQNQELVRFYKPNGTDITTCNTITVEADTVDLYFSVVPQNVQLSFTNEPVYFVRAGEVITVSGISMTGIKFSNALGAKYYIQGLGY